MFFLGGNFSFSLCPKGWNLFTYKNYGSASVGATLNRLGQMSKVTLFMCQRVCKGHILLY